MKRVAVVEDQNVVAALLVNVVANSIAPLKNAPDFLINREVEILQSVAESYRTQEIAAKLGIIAKTVGNHHTNRMRKLNLHDVANFTR